jgi:hypothetical protein
MVLVWTVFSPSTYGDFVSIFLQKHLCRIPSTFFFVAQKQTLPPTTILPSGHPMSTIAVPLMHYCSLAVTQVLVNYWSTYGDVVSFLQKHLCRIPSAFFFVAPKQTLPPTTILPSGHPMSTTAVPLMHYCSLAVTQVLVSYW